MKITNKKILLSIIIVLVIGSGLTAYLLFANKNKTEVIINKNVSPEKRAELEERKAKQLEFLKEFPDYYEAYLDLGNIEQEFGNYQDSLKYYEKAWEIIPANSTPILNKASVYVEMGELDKAYEEFWRAQKVNPNYFLVYKKIIDFYNWYYQDKINTIDDVYRMGLDNTKNDADLLKDYANYLYNNNRIADSLPFYEKLLQLRPVQSTYDRITEIRKKMGIE